MAKRTDTKSMHTALRMELARAVADREIPDDVIGSVSKQLVELHGRWPIQRLDICVYGICIDRLVPIDSYREVLGQVLDAKVPIRRLELFPWGIIDWDFMQIRVEHQIEELSPFVRGMGR
jgi:hypothetical protein